MSSKDQKASVEDLLQCSVCMNSYGSSGTRIPKMLSCQHSFCMACLRSIVQNNRIQCPLCRQEFEASVDQLPRNLLLLQLIDRAGTSTDDSPNEDYAEVLKQFYENPSRAKEALQSLDNGIVAGERYSQELLQVAFICMAYHRVVRSSSSRDVLVAATAFVYRFLVRAEESISNQLLGQVADEVVLALEAFKGCQQLQINCIGILRNDHILRQQNFDHFKAAKLVMEISNDIAGALQVFSQLSKKLDKEQNSLLGTDENMKKFLVMLNDKLAARTYDDSLHWLLEALADLTAGIPATCFRIVNENGTYYLLEVLQESSINDSTKCTALMVLNNLSEVAELREEIIKYNSLVHTLQDLLKARGNRITFVCAGVIAYLSTVPKATWTKLTGKDGIRDELLASLKRCVKGWKHGAAELNIAIKSFSSYHVLLRRYDAPPVQLFAAWIIRNFCAFDTKYEEMLIREQGIDILLELQDNVYADSDVRELARKTLAAIH